MINFSVMKFLGNNNWSEIIILLLFPLLSTTDDDNVNDNLDLLAVPQYGRNPNYTG